MNAMTAPAANPMNRRQARQFIVRANAPLFYSVAIASFVEAEAAAACARMTAADEKLRQWLDSQWLTSKSTRAARLKQYVEQWWPEFDWAGAYEHYLSLREQQAECARAVAAPAQAFVRCVNAVQAAIYYRALAAWSDDHALRELARSIAHEEAIAFSEFRAAYERQPRRQRLGAFGALRVVRAAARHARDTRIATAFEAVNAACRFNAPFPVLDYPEFLTRMRAVIARCARPTRVERLLFGLWLRTPRVAPAGARPQRTSFKPVLAHAA